MTLRLAMRFGLLLAGLFLFTPYLVHSQVTGVTPDAVDSDRDGLSDQLEGALLDQFSPRFMVSHEDCSSLPARFIAGAPIPTVAADDGTIYGQVFPRKGHADEVELHYYHLWRRDCGEMGHRLDAEHVSVLVKRGKGIHDDWKAMYWYAAAHEDTICDASHVTRAATIDAENHGATVWVSEGKHASFLNAVLCKYGCGGDRCAQMEALRTQQIINLGEPGAPMNGITWLESPEWPLADKLQRTDFTDIRVARLERLPDTDISWANPAKRPAQGVILGANAGIGGATTGARATDTALVLANAGTTSALGHTADQTGHALKSSSRNVWKSLKEGAQKTGQFLDGVNGK